VRSGDVGHGGLDLLLGTTGSLRRAAGFATLEKLDGLLQPPVGQLQSELCAGLGFRGQTELCPFGRALHGIEQVARDRGGRCVDRGQGEDDD
jgi:hypothetical protein